MQTEAVSSAKSDVISMEPGKDPVLLGVSLPVAATVTAATQVKEAWLDAFNAVIAAARAKASEKKASVSKKTNGAVEAVKSEIDA